MSRRFANFFALGILLGLFLPVSVAAQKLTSLTATAQGRGTLISRSGDKHALTGVLVILKEDGTAAITLYADLQIYGEAKWSAGEDLSKGIDLKITGGIVGGSASGTGKLFLRENKSIRTLNLEVKGATGGTVTVEFVADEKTNSPD